MLKYVAAYRNMPHSSTEEKPSRLMFSRDIRTKLLQHVKVPEDQHHKDARKCETVAKVKMKRYFDKKKKTKLVEFRMGDKSYVRHLKPNTIRGPWESTPHRIIKITGNRLTGRRNGTVITRDRNDWKLVKELPEQLQNATDAEEQQNRGNQPTRQPRPEGVVIPP